MDVSPDISITRPKQETPVMSSGIQMSDKLFITQSDSKNDLRRWLQAIDPRLLASRNLTVLAQTPEDMCGRVNCFPTAAMVAINTLLNRKVFSTGLVNGPQSTLYDVYNAGVLSHINDRKAEEGSILQKGYPSFHFRNGEMYHQFVIALARRFGLDGFMIRNFKDVSFLKNVVQNGGLVLLSVDNLFIKDVVVPHLKLQPLSASKHAEIIHGVSGNSVVYSDVFNQRDNQTWQTLNLVTTPQQFNRYLFCPRLNDFGTRGIVLFPKSSDVKSFTKLPPDVIVSYPEPHPILKSFPQMSLPEWNRHIETLYLEKKLAEWNLVDYLTSSGNLPALR